MLKTLKLRSNDIKKLNEVLQKLTISEGAQIIKNPLLEADGKFTSIINMDKDFNHNVINNIDVEEEKSEKELTKKAHLVDEVKSKLRQALENNEEITRLLKKIDKINSDTKTNEWVLNDAENVAMLKEKNAEIFKQNNNLCLSVNDDVHLFGSVRELHDWLINHNLPVPKGISLKEAVERETDPNHKKGYKHAKIRVDGSYQPTEIKTTVEKINELQDLMLQNGMTDTNALLSSVFKNDNTIEREIQNKKELDSLKSDEDTEEVEECTCTTTGDLGMATTYLADKKDESTLEEVWQSSPIFGLFNEDGKTARVFKDAKAGAHAVCEALFNDKAFALNDNETIQMTQEELDHWKDLAEEMDYLIVAAIPSFCQKAANDYVNEKIEKLPTKGMSEEAVRDIVKQKVKAIFGYDLNDEEFRVCRKRNPYGRDVANLDPAIIRTKEEQALAEEVKRKLGQSQGARENVVDEVFGHFDKDYQRAGYAKYKKFITALQNGKIEVVDQHDEVNNVLPVSKKPAAKVSTQSEDEIILSLFGSGKIPEAKERFKKLSPKMQDIIKNELIDKRGPTMQKIIDRWMKESVENTSVAKVFLDSINN